MFDTLIESRPRRERSVTQAMGSVAAHLILITVAVKLTSGAAETVTRMLASPQLAFLKPPPATPPPPSPPERRTVVSANPPPQGFQTVAPPRGIPTAIPPVNLGVPFDPRNFTGRGLENGWADDGVPGPGHEPVPVPFTDAQVDDPVQPTHCPEPRYPTALRTVGVTGSVALRYVVGLDGRAEPGSIKVITSTNSAFELPAIETIGQCRFQPARIKGRAVRQLVEQNVRFTIGG